MPNLRDIDWHDLPVTSLRFRERSVELDVETWDEEGQKFVAYRLTLSHYAAIVVSMGGRLTQADQENLEFARLEYTEPQRGAISGTLGLLPGSAGYWELKFEDARWNLELLSGTLR